MCEGGVAREVCLGGEFPGGCAATKNPGVSCQAGGVGVEVSGLHWVADIGEAQILKIRKLSGGGGKIPHWKLGSGPWDVRGLGLEEFGKCKVETRDKAFFCGTATPAESCSCVARRPGACRLQTSRDAAHVPVIWCFLKGC